MVSAPLPPRIIEKCLASVRVVIDPVVGKYCNHTPLPRQGMILERDIGLEISRATLDGWVLKVSELLIPIVAAMRRELISGSYIQADETPVDVQAHEGRGQNHQAYLWQYSRWGTNNFVSIVIELLQHRPSFVNRCVGQTLTMKTQKRDTLLCSVATER